MKKDSKYIHQNNIDFVGKKFNRLVVLKITAIRNKEGRIWRCLCDCGNITYSKSTPLKNGMKKSCGCLKKETKGNFKHGLSRTPEYSKEYNLKRKYGITLKQYYKMVDKQKNKCLICGNPRNP